MRLPVRRSLVLLGPLDMVDELTFTGSCTPEREVIPVRQRGQSAGLLLCVAFGVVIRCWRRLHRHLALCALRRPFRLQRLVPFALNPSPRVVAAGVVQ